MTIVLDTRDVTGVPAPQRSRGGIRPATAIGAETRVEDGSRYRTIGSASALAIAVGASLLVTGLLRIVL